MSKTRTIEYRGYLIYVGDEGCKVCDKHGNLLKTSISNSRGGVSDMKYYVDSIIKRYGN